VHLYEKYKGRVQFVIVDLDKPRSAAQQELVKKYYTGYIPHVVVLDKKGIALYNRAGEEDEDPLSKTLDQALAQ
jgi:thioredoxin-like negative regulator of GroEL